MGPEGRVPEGVSEGMSPERASGGVVNVAARRRQAFPKARKSDEAAGRPASALPGWTLLAQRGGGAGPGWGCGLTVPQSWESAGGLRGEGEGHLNASEPGLSVAERTGDSAGSVRTSSGDKSPALHVASAPPRLTRWDQSLCRRVLTAGGPTAMRLNDLTARCDSPARTF